MTDTPIRPGDFGPDGDVAAEALDPVLQTLGAAAGSVERV